MPGPQPLFFIGLGRSGTTVLARLFGSHPRIAVGMERYKKAQTDPDVEITREFFQRDRFFDFSDGFTNIRPDVHQRWRDYYDAIAAKWDTVEYVGDKLTGVAMDRIWESIPEARFVCIIRDVHHVAASWERRATNPADVAWSESRGARAAVRPWNSGLQRIAAAHRRHPDQVSVVEYERLYGDPEGASARSVLTWLGLEWTDDFGAAFDQVHQQYVGEVAPRQRFLSTDDAAYIAEHAALGRWKRLRDLAV